MPVVAFSGGLDSCIVLGDVLTKHDTKEIFTITFDYGQPALDQELKSVQNILSYYDLPPTKIVAIPILPELKVPALPEGTPTVTNLASDDETKRLIKKHTFLPFRNFLFMAIASAYCHSIEQRQLLFGFTLPNGEFPDADGNFVQLSNRILECTVVEDTSVHVAAPLLELSKSKVVELGSKIDAPMHLSFSCFNNGSEHCGKCANCLGRKKAFIEAGITDRTTYYE